jgi:hypothetical protein
MEPVTIGPLGFPMLDRQAIALDAIIKALPKEDAFKYRKAVIADPPSEIKPGERSDVSWISYESVDREGDVIVSKGMNDSQFKLNPIVTLEHNYDMPAVGKSLWRKIITDGTTAGIKAKTIYPTRPADWNPSKEWPADVVFSLVKAGLMQGKSVGALPTKIHFPAEGDQKLFGKSVKLVVDEWLLIEYACTMLPIQQNAIIESISKSGMKISPELAKALKITMPTAQMQPEPPPPEFTFSRFTPIEEIGKAFTRKIESIDLTKVAEKAAQDALDRHRGRI